MGILDFAEIPLLLLFPPQLGVARIHTNRVCTYIHVCMQVNCAQSQWSKEKGAGRENRERFTIARALVAISVYLLTTPP